MRPRHTPSNVRETSGEEEAAKAPPYRTLPMQALDHTAGYLLAFDSASQPRFSAPMLLWIRRFGNLHPLAAFGEGRLVDPEVKAVSTTIERDPGDVDIGWEGQEGLMMRE